MRSTLKRAAQSVLIAASLALGAPIAHAAGSAPLPPEAFFKHPSVLSVKLSPSGRHVAMTALKDDKRVMLLVVDLESKEPARSLVYYAKQDVVDFGWVNNDRLYFRLGQIEPAKSATHLPGLFAVDVQGKQIVELICSEIKSCLQQSGALGIDPYRGVAYQHLFVPRAQEGVRPNEIIVGKVDLQLKQVAPLWLDSTSGVVRSMSLPAAPAGTQSWWFDSKGRARLLLTVDEDKARGAYHWLAPDADRWRELASFDLLKPPFEAVGVSDDGKLYVTEERGPAKETVLTTFDFETGKPAAKPIVQVPGFDFAGYLIHSDIDGHLLGVQVEADSGVTVWLDEGMKRFQAEVDAKFDATVNRISCVHCGQPDMVALVFAQSDRDPGRYLLYRAATKRWEVVMPVMPGIDAKQMAGVDFQRIKARDGRELPVWITMPQGVEPGKPAPTIVLPHGGPWVRGGAWRWEPMAQFLASRGYLVLEPEFRGSTGYGRAHLEAGFKQWGRAMQDDLVDTLAWARKQGIANDKACVMGASYGGYATLMGLVRHPDFFRCGVAWVAVADLPLFLEGSMWVLDDIPRWARKHGLPERVGDPKKDAAELAEVSPVVQAARIKAPLLLAMGDEDVRVPPEHGRRLRDAMTKAGNPPEYIEYKNEGHGWQHLSARVDFAQRVEAFLAKQLRGTEGAGKAP